jgi:hypothetical protein
MTQKRKTPFGNLSWNKILQIKELALSIVKITAA